MDALSTIGLAAAVMQFFQFAAKACRIAYHFHQDQYGDFHENIFVNMKRDFTHFSELFKSRGQTGPNQAFSQNQEALDKLIGECQRTAAELAHLFHGISIDKIAKDNNVHLVRRIAKFKVLWKKPEIDRLLVQLEDYRKQLAPYMLACLPALLDVMNREQRDRFDNVDRSHSQIVEVFAVVNENLDLLSHQNEQLRNKMDHLQSTTSVLHEQAMAAFLTFRNGESELLTKTDSGNLSHRGQQSLITMRDEDSSVIIEEFRPVQTMIQDSLYFRQFYERIENVRDAHKDTYEWIFCSPEAEKPWSPFVEWLEIGTGCYWINGKPGSGKSTLMKFIAQHDQTKKALAKWADNNLVTASFFFWNLGSPLQRSQVGLLRSLLHEILTQHPGLISVVMPDLWRIAARLPKGNNLDAPSLAELKRWMRNAVKPAVSSLKFFFVIDGIDEFEGDHNDIVELINDIVGNENVKILLSSRPIPVCESSFSHWPSLRLQDLTRGSIQIYTRDHLAEALQQKSGDEWTALINEITDRSYGVFLWVVLVVQSLREGLRNGDTIQELRKRLDELPSDLRKLYVLMIKKLDQRYQHQASELFQLLLRAHQVQSSAGFPRLLQMAFCGDEANQVISLPIRPLSDHDRRAKCEETDSRICSRGCGLVERRRFYTGRYNVHTTTQVTFDYVDFIHRTVVEFLRLPEIWTNLVELTATPASQAYDPSPQLFRSCVMMCKTLPKSRGIDLEMSTLWHMMDRALIYASIAEDSGTPVARSHLKELDNILMSHWRDMMKCYSRLGSCNNEGHWVNGYMIDPLRQHVLDPNDFASVVLFHGLGDYLKGELADEAAVKRIDTTRLLFNAMKYIGPPPWDTEVVEFNGGLTSEEALYMDRQVILRPRWVKIAILLLEVKADPNKPIAGNESAWSLMLSYLTAAGGPRTKMRIHRDIEAKGFAHLFAKLLDSFIKHGADLSFQATADADPAWKAIDRLFSYDCGAMQESDPWAEQPVAAVSDVIKQLCKYFRDRIEADPAVEASPSW